MPSLKSQETLFEILLGDVFCYVRYPAPVRRAHPLSPPVLPGPRPVGMRPPHLHPRGPPGPHPHHVCELNAASD